MQKDEAVMWFGSQRKLAKFLGVAQSNVCSWKLIPRHHQITIQKHTSGELIAEEDIDTKKARYMCSIEQAYINMMKDHAEKIGVPVVEILRRALKMFDEQHRY